MKRQDKINLIASCIGTSKIVRTYFKYDENYWYYYPNAINERFVLGQEENDFQPDGYHIRKISDLTKAEIKKDLCEQINLWNGVAYEIKAPEIDITSWQSIFRSPVLQGRFIIVEDEINGLFKIGRIKKRMRDICCWTALMPMEYGRMNRLRFLTQELLIWHGIQDTLRIGIGI